MDYDKSKSPIENIELFFNAVKVLRYEWIGLEIEGKIKYYLDSPWKNEVGLKDITLDFQQKFTKHLVKISMDDSQTLEYMSYLRECKELLRQFNHYYSPSFHEVLIITRPEVPDENELIVNPDKLPPEYKMNIQRCYELFIVLFKNLMECVNDEIKEYERKEYVRDKSTYTWTGDKNELSEISLALFLSGAIRRRDGREPKAGTFARELAGFFGVDKSNFDQDVVAMMIRTHGSQTEFLEFIKKKVEEYFAQRIDNQG